MMPLIVYYCLIYDLDKRGGESYIAIESTLAKEQPRNVAIDTPTRLYTRQWYAAHGDAVREYERLRAVSAPVTA